MSRCSSARCSQRNRSCSIWRSASAGASDSRTTVTSPSISACRLISTASACSLIPAVHHGVLHDRPQPRQELRGARWPVVTTRTATTRAETARLGPRRAARAQSHRLERPAYPSILLSCAKSSTPAYSLRSVVRNPIWKGTSPSICVMERCSSISRPLNQGRRGFKDLGSSLACVCRQGLSRGYMETRGVGPGVGVGPSRAGVPARSVLGSSRPA